MKSRNCRFRDAIILAVCAAMRPLFHLCEPAFVPVLPPPSERPAVARGRPFRRAVDQDRVAGWGCVSAVAATHLRRSGLRWRFGVPEAQLFGVVGVPGLDGQGRAHGGEDGDGQARRRAKAFRLGRLVFLKMPILATAKTVKRAFFGFCSA